MEDNGEQSVVIVGAGPRGTSVVERLLAHLKGDPRQLTIHVVDPFPPGPGHVWRTEQSRLFLMNTQAFFPTLFPDQPLGAESTQLVDQLGTAAAAEISAAPEAKPLVRASFDDWLSEQQLEPHASLSEADREEISTLSHSEFPSRALYGRYLSWAFEQLRQNLPTNVTLLVHETTALELTPDPDTADVVLNLANGQRIRASSAVLALGHVEGLLSPAQQGLANQAMQAGLSYFPPAVPADVDWESIPDRATVLVRGMGLNFFDALGQLTEGRGGRFVSTGKGPGHTFGYVPSGREPKIIGGSRRGTPYRAKAELDSYYPRSIELRFLTSQKLKEMADAGQLLGFNHDLWPLMLRDALWAYYTTLAKHQPETITASDFLERLDSQLHKDVETTGGAWADQLETLLSESVEEAKILRLETLAKPLSKSFDGQDGKHRFESQQALDQAVLAYLIDDAESSALGEADPTKMAIGAMNAGRAVMKTLIATVGISDESWLAEVRGWFESFLEGLTSGPPALRSEQLAALVRAGVVQFTGPDPVFAVVDGAFEVSSPWVAAPPWRANVMVEALAPANRVNTTASPLLRKLVDDGHARPRVMLAADGEPEVTSGLDVAKNPYRPITSTGDVLENVYVLGLQLSSVQMGTAIAAQAKAEYVSGYRTLVDADMIARHILR